MHMQIQFISFRISKLKVKLSFASWYYILHNNLYLGEIFHKNIYIIMTFTLIMFQRRSCGGHRLCHTVREPPAHTSGYVDPAAATRAACAPTPGYVERVFVDSRPNPSAFQAK